ncbi:hypothetical protein A2U01_0088785, partial [Trifolium medium]|nr:hypothetical protein [Trifolium medium]
MTFHPNPRPQSRIPGPQKQLEAPIFHNRIPSKHDAQKQD